MGRCLAVNGRLGHPSTGDWPAPPLAEGRKLFSMPYLAGNSKKVALFPRSHSVIIDMVRTIAQRLWVRKTHLSEQARDCNN